MLLREELPFRIYRANARGTGALSLGAAGQLQLWHINNPHPEVSWKVLFGQVHYENYNQPARVWQSSSASDDFEPKLSFIPLMFGSLKATLFALVFVAVPIGVVGGDLHQPVRQSGGAGGDQARGRGHGGRAVGGHRLSHRPVAWPPAWRRGWVAVGLFAVIMPLAFILFMALWQGMRRFQWAKRLERGREFLILVPGVADGGAGRVGGGAVG